MKKVVLTALALILACASQSSIAADAEDESVQFLNSAQPAAADLPFSEAVRVGNMLFLSGQIGVNSQSDELVPGGIKAEARQTMENIKRSLSTHGYAMSDVVKCTVMLADISEWRAFNEIYIAYFSKPYPARSAFGATGLALNARVEVECIAVSSSKR